jgi:hypothetical protein
MIIELDVLLHNTFKVKGDVEYQKICNILFCSYVKYL